MSINILKNIDIWILSYMKQLFYCKSGLRVKTIDPRHIIFTICDHFEPFWNNPDEMTAFKRVRDWKETYPPIALKHRDCLGNYPKYGFFYPIEEYRHDLIEMTAEICRQKLGEIEVHLHHENDDSENLKHTLLEYINTLHEQHGLLPRSRKDSSIKYGFIHGNWALDNSRPDGRCCGVNDEITILEETGCYADFTMPSAPSDTQTRTINSMYYAVDDPDKPKSHDTGIPVTAGTQIDEGLLCIQGPLCFNTKWRKWGLVPRIENGYLSHEIPLTDFRIELWVKQNIHVLGRDDVVFVKLYTHGTQEGNSNFLLMKGALDELFSLMESYCKDKKSLLYYTSPRQMYNVVKGLEHNKDAQISDLLDHELTLDS